MAQAPAVPKWARASRLLRARLGLLSDTDSNPDSNLAPSEIAALRVRRAAPAGATPTCVHFNIPLVGPASVGDWGSVTDLLNKTLASFLRQSDPRWRATICCQTRPPLPDDPRISYLPFDEASPGNDKWRKLDRLYSHLPHSVERAVDRGIQGAGLAMTFDADDLAAPTLVAKLLSHPGGALLTQGFVYDVGANRLALAKPQSLRSPQSKALWKLCGSCAALPFDSTQPNAKAQFAFLRCLSQHEHRMIPYLSQLAGMRLFPVDVPEVVYMLNHGENFGARRGRVSFKSRFVERFEVQDPTVQDMAREIYGLPQTSPPPRTT